MGQILSRIYGRDIASTDGLILNRVATDVGNSQTRYTYIDWLAAGYRFGSIQHILTATTLTIEACNMQSERGAEVSSAATSTDGTGATLVDSSLTATYAADDDLIGCQIIIISDTTTPSNVGLKREIVDYTTASGTCTLASAFGATTSGVTKYKLIDGATEFTRRVSDPTSAQWADVTSALTGAASHTTSGIWFFDTDIAIERIRIKQVTTNATNALKLRLSRGR